MEFWLKLKLKFGFSYRNFITLILSVSFLSYTLQASYLNCCDIVDNANKEFLGEIICKIIVNLGINITWPRSFSNNSELDSSHVHVATGLLELKTLIPFCIEDRAYLVSRAPVVCFSPHRSCMYGVMSSSVHFSRSVKRWLKRSSVSSERSSTRSREMVSGRELRSTRATLWKIYTAVSTAASFSRGVI